MQSCFTSNIGYVAKTLQMVLGALNFQAKFQYLDRELVEQITENPYQQYFIGLPGYQEEAPFNASILVDFRKRITVEMLMEANEYMLEYKDDRGGTPQSSETGTPKNSSWDEEENRGTLILDTTWALVNICYPQSSGTFIQFRQAVLRHGPYRKKTETKTVDIYYNVCIRDESF